MDHYLQQFGPTNDAAPDSQLDGYGGLLSHMDRAGDAHSSLAFSSYRQQNLTPESSNDEGMERSFDGQFNASGQHRQIKTENDSHTSHQQWQVGSGLHSDMTPDSQQDGSFSPQSQASTSAQGCYGQPQQWAGYDSLFSANVDQAAAFDLPQSVYTGVFPLEAQTLGRNQLRLDEKQHLAAYQHPMNRNMGGQRAFDMEQPRSRFALQEQGVGVGDAPFRQGHVGNIEDGPESVGRNEYEQRMIAQPQAVHGGSAQQDSHASYLSSQVEMMGTGPRTLSSQSDVGLGPLFANDAGMPQAGSIPARSPGESDCGLEPLPDLVVARRAMDNDDGLRRASMTTDISRDMTQFRFKPESPESTAERVHVFKKPSLPPQGLSLADRRLNQRANAGQTRPKALNLRAVSSSAVPSSQAAGRFPTSPHGTLRRNKSSNVLAGANGVLSGRIQKSGPGSARNSPLMPTFPEEVPTLQQASAQLAPTTPTSASSSSSNVMQVPLSQGLADASQEAAVPLSAGVSVYTPGLHSGGSVHGGQSWMNTPITTPFGPSNHTVPVKAHWAPASSVPQSAPAHVLSFPRDMSPPTMPSMPLTPANTHFVQTHAPMHMVQTPMGQQMYPVVPSQHGLSENPAFLPSQQSHFLQMHQSGSWSTQGPWVDPYQDHALWLMQNTILPQKEIEVKLDPGCDKLRKEVSKGEATLVRLKPGEFTFQNTTTSEMKKNLEVKE